MQQALPENNSALQPSQHRPWQVFSRANVQYAVALEDGSELLEHAGVSAVPFPPQGVVGLVNWHGNAIPLADIARLNGAPRRMDAGRALVLGHGDDALALALDSLPNVVRLAPEFVQSPAQAPAEISELLDGVLLLPDRSKAYWLNKQRAVQRLALIS
jgi:chemotaxis signal transduction protein